MGFYEKYAEAEQERRCVFRQVGVICKMNPDCSRCGWNPEVETQRIEKIKRKRTAKMLNIPERELDPPEAGADEIPYCPICHRECYEVYYDQDGVLFGCNECVKRNPAEMEPQCLGGQE